LEIPGSQGKTVAIRSAVLAEMTPDLGIATVGFASSDQEF
jgi:hypothetical protein